MSEAAPIFDPIKSHGDHYKGPAQGLASEHGDSWPTAVDKINKGFANVSAILEGFDPAALPPPAGEPGATPEEVGNVIEAALKPLMEQIASLSALVDNLGARMAAVEDFFNAQADQGAPQLPPAEAPPQS